MTTAGGSKTSGGKEKEAGNRASRLREEWAWEADVVAARGGDRLAGFSVFEVYSLRLQSHCALPHSGTWGDFGLQAPPPVTAARLAAEPRAAPRSTALCSDHWTQISLLRTSEKDQHQFSPFFYLSEALTTQQGQLCYTTSNIKRKQF